MKKLLTLLFTFVVATSLAIPVVSYAASGTLETGKAEGKEKKKKEKKEKKQKKSKKEKKEEGKG